MFIFEISTSTQTVRRNEIKEPTQTSSIQFEIDIKMRLFFNVCAMNANLLTWNREFLDAIHWTLLDSYWYSSGHQMRVWNVMESLWQTLFHLLMVVLLMMLWLLVSLAIHVVDLVAHWIVENKPAKHGRPIAVLSDPLTLWQNVMSTINLSVCVYIVDHNLWFVFPMMRPIPHHLDI